MVRTPMVWNPSNSLLMAIAVAFLSLSTLGPDGTGAAAALLPDLPASFSGAWTGPSGDRGSSQAPRDGSNRKLEEQAARETREAFGEDFSRQLEDEQEAVRDVHRRKASVGADAGCHPSSPLSSTSSERLSLSSLGAFGSPGDADGDGGKSKSGFEDPMADWLR